MPIGLLGIVAATVALICGVVAYSYHRKVHAMVVTETYTARELFELGSAAAQAAGPGAFRQRCEAQGVTAPGPQGLLKSEIGHFECVWHRHVVTRKYWGSGGGDNKGLRQKEEEVAEHVSANPFLVADETGPVMVRPETAKVIEPVKVVERFDRAETENVEVSAEGFTLSVPVGTIGYKYEEWILPPGRQLYVFGEASDATGEIVVGKPDKGSFVISTRNEMQLIQHARLRQRLFFVIAVFAALITAADMIFWGLIL